MKDGRDNTQVATGDGRPTAADGEKPPPERASVSRVPAERYKVVNRLGKGGMGEVMQVRDVTIGREVALKRIRRADPSDRLVERFLREASIQGRLEHPSIVPLYDIGYDEQQQPFFTMKKLTGTTLSKILTGDRKEFSLQRLLRAFAEVCLAIEFAHVRGVIHRDLKPENIMLGDFGEVYVLDWGVAKVVGEPDEFADVDSGSSEDDNERATIPGTSIGTPGYMSPEQVRGEREIDPRTDVYALGCILFEILANDMMHPRGRAGFASALAGVAGRPSVRAPDRVIPPELDDLCVAAVKTDRDQRLATARELGDRVQRFLDGDRDLAARHKLAREHLAAAQAAFAAGDTDEQRRKAMREAAAAIALDPGLEGAAELVGRLMLEPPRTTPGEVDEAIQQDELRTMRGNSRVGMYAYAFFLAFTPLLWWIGPADSPYFLAVIGLVLVSMGICRIGTRLQKFGLEGALAITNALLLGVIARMFTPLLIAPGLAAMSAMAIVWTPTRSRFTSAFGMTLLPGIAVLGPFLLERMGHLSLTTIINENGILLKPAGIAGDESTTLLVAALYVATLIVTAAGMARGMRSREREAKHTLHLQAWQLRQLVPR